MKIIGLIGGMSWESTVTYYQLINQMTNRFLGGLHSAKLVIYSVDFHEIEQCQASGEWEHAGAILAEATQKLVAAGAEIILLCTNTMHKVAEQIQVVLHQVQIPFLHIAEPTIEALKKDHINHVALLGTQYTLTQPFYKTRLIEAGLNVLIPNPEAIQKINQVIFEELCLGIISEISKHYYLSVIEQLKAQGAEAVILGCTEINLLINLQDTTLPIFDTTFLHCDAAVRWSLGINERI